MRICEYAILELTNSQSYCGEQKILEVTFSASDSDTTQERGNHFQNRLVWNPPFPAKNP